MMDYMLTETKGFLQPSLYFGKVTLTLTLVTVMQEMIGLHLQAQMN